MKGFLPQAVQEVFLVKAWHLNPPRVSPLTTVTILADDTIYAAKSAVSRVLAVKPSQVRFFFGPELYDGGVVCEDALHAIGNQLTDEIIDAVTDEKTQPLCECSHFARTLFVCTTASPETKRPSLAFGDNESGEEVDESSRACKIAACALRELPPSIRDVKETIEIRCVADFFSSARKSYTPEYMFSRIVLSEQVPFAMCRSLVEDVECPIRVHNAAANLCKRHWPFWNLRCSRPIRPSGILFRVFPSTATATATATAVASESTALYPQRSTSPASYAIEWLPNGVYRVTLEQYSVNPANIPTDLPAKLMQICRSVYDTLVGDKEGSAESAFCDVRICYFAFTGVPDIRKLVDDEIRDHLFRVNPHEGGAVTGTGIKNVCLYYEPCEEQRSDRSNLVQCNFVRSTSNSIMCRAMLRTKRVSFLSALHAIAAMRAMVVKTLPNECSQSYSKLGIEIIDPELYSSVKNSALSRKTWSCKEKATSCHRNRSAVALNPKSARDMERYNRATESGPLLMYRGVFYAACDDENINGEQIRRLRQENNEDREETLPAKPAKPAKKKKICC